MLYPHPEIALHLNPRFQYGIRSACVVMNCWTEGAWGREERHNGYLCWAPGREFLLTYSIGIIINKFDKIIFKLIILILYYMLLFFYRIQCGNDSYIIWLENKIIGEFKHRVKFSKVDTLVITGDVVVYEVALSFGE